MTKLHCKITLQNYIAKLLLFLFLCANFQLDAQLFSIKESRSACDFSAEEGQRLDSINALNDAKEVILTEVQSPFDLSNPSVITFEIPGIDGCITVEAIKLDYQDDQNFIWSGNLADNQGHFILVRTEGYTGGALQVYNKGHFGIFPVSQEVSALVEYDLDFGVFDMDDAPTNTSNNSTDNNSIDLCAELSADCRDTPQEITIMVLLSEEADDWLVEEFSNGTISGLGLALNYVTVGIESINVALANSDINNVTINWFVESRNFDFGRQDGEDQDNLRADVENLITDQDIQELREQRAADLVVLLSNENYFDGNGFGRAGTLDVERGRAYAITEIRSLVNPRWTLVHEVGHLLGARHQRGADNADVCCHAVRLGNNLFTVVHTLGLVGERALTFSMEDENDNAFCIRNAACVVSDFYQDNLSAFIMANQDCHEEGQLATFEAIIDPAANPVAQGFPPYTYSWTWSADGNNLIPFGNQITSDPLPLAALQARRVFIYLTITSIDGFVVNSFGVSDRCDLPPTLTSICQSCDSLTLGIVAQLPNCTGTNDGRVTLQPKGGQKPYTFLWANGDTATTRTNLAKGTYSVTVNDAAGCSKQFSVELKGENRTLSITPRTNDSDCNASTGNIRLTVEGNTSPYTYKWSNGSTAKNLLNIPEGTYTITVTDRNGCVAIRTYQIKERGEPSVSLQVTNTSCGEDNGAIDLTVSGGNAPYTIDWDYDCTANTEDLTGLPAGTYKVVVTASGGCKVSASVEVLGSSRIRLLASATGSFGNQNNGSIDLITKGGKLPYRYDWSKDGTGDFDDTEDLINLAPGTYNVVVKDNNECSATTSATVINTALVTLAVNTTPGGCNGGLSSIQLNVTGGLAPFSYAWKPQSGSTWTSATSSDRTYTFTGLAAGAYDLRVIDAANVQATAQTTIAISSGLAISNVSVIDATCGTANGIIQVTVSGGTAPYTYRRGTFTANTNSTNYSFSGVAAGIYDISVSDASGCTATQEAVVYGDLDPLTLVATRVQGASCPSGGEAIFQVAGGSPNFRWEARNNSSLGTTFGQTGERVIRVGPLSDAPYNITITDQDGCKIQANVTVPLDASNCNFTSCLVPPCSSTSDPLVTTGPTVGSCQSGNNGGISHYCSGGGYINVSAEGGVGQLTYSWTRSAGGTTQVVATTEDLSTSLSGSFKVKITDGQGTNQELGPWNLYDPMSVNLAYQCNGATFDLRANALGGSQCKRYTWTKNGINTDDGDNSAYELKGQTAGSYTVYVDDERTGCRKGAVITLTGTCNGASALANGSINSPHLENAISLNASVDPNPFERTLNVRLNTLQDQTVSITVLNLVGQTIHQQRVQATAGQNTVVLDFPAAFGAGIYQVLVKDEAGMVQTFKVLQMR